MRPLRLLPTLICLLLFACATPQDRDGPGRTISPYDVADARPRAEKKSKYGNPDTYVVNGQRYAVLKNSSGYVARGLASWYGKKFHGRRTSSGEIYDMYRATAAHRTLPIPVYAIVTNLDNGRQVVVKINDRGPFHSDRIIDLSYGAAVKIGMAAKGTGRVEVRVIEATASTAAPESRAMGQQNPAPAGRDIYIQVGAFKLRNNAQEMRFRCRQAGLPTATVHPDQLVTGEVVYKVLIGPYRDPTQLDRAVADLHEASIHDFKLITR